jgi:hypothetical protein
VTILPGKIASGFWANHFDAPDGDFDWFGLIASRSLTSQTAMIGDPTGQRAACPNTSPSICPVPPRPLR